MTTPMAISPGATVAWAACAASRQATEAGCRVRKCWISCLLDSGCHVYDPDSIALLGRSTAIGQNVQSHAGPDRRTFCVHSNVTLRVPRCPMLPSKYAHSDHQPDPFADCCCYPACCAAGGLQHGGDVAVRRHRRAAARPDLISTVLMLLIIVPVIVLTLLFAWRYRAVQHGADLRARLAPFDPARSW